MSYVEVQIFKYLKESRAVAKESAIRILHFSCEPTIKDEECKNCGIDWDYEKAMFCDCDENNIYSHHDVCKTGKGWAFDFNDKGEMITDVDGFKSDAFEMFENILQSFDRIPLITSEFRANFEQCENTNDTEHFQSKRTKKCAKCLQMKGE